MPYLYKKRLSRIPTKKSPRRKPTRKARQGAVYGITSRRSALR